MLLPSLLLLVSFFTTGFAAPSATSDVGQIVVGLEGIKAKTSVLITNLQSFDGSNQAMTVGFFFSFENENTSQDVPLSFASLGPRRCHCDGDRVRERHHDHYPGKSIVELHGRHLKSWSFFQATGELNIAGGNVVLT